MATTQSKKIMVGPDEGEHLPILDITHKVSAKRQGVSLTTEEWSLPPGEMIPPHTHAREDECTFVLEGELTCLVGDEIVVAPVGSYVVKPRDVQHAFYNAGAETVRVMEILTPGEGFEGYFDEYERIVSSEMDQEERQMARTKLGERYGITWHDDRIPETRARFGIGS